MGNELIIIFGINLLTTCFAAVLSTRIIQKVGNRLKFITYWIVVGVLLSLLPLLLSSSFFNFSLISNVVGPANINPIISSPASFVTVAFISGAVGLYCGFGAPVLLGYYSATTKSIHRAKISGLIIFLTCLSFIPVILLARNPMSTAVVLSIWKLCGLFALILLKPSEATFNKEENISYKSLLKTREIILYLIPWLMFSMVNNFAIPALNIGFGSDIIAPITMLENLIAGIFAVIFGFAADRFGRKRLLFLGFTLMGFGYVTLSMFSSSIEALYFYTLVDGIAWGIFTTLFILTIWSDIASERNAEKFFIIGFLPYILSTFMQIVFGQFIADSVTDSKMIFFLISLFIFIAVTPLYLAPETLSEKEKRDNELKSYLTQAQKKVEKENSKRQRKKNKIHS
jgi:MFS family permease